MKPDVVYLQPMKLVTVMTKAIILCTHFTTEEVNHLAKKEVQWMEVIKMLKAWGRDFQAHLWATRAFEWILHSQDIQANLMAYKYTHLAPFWLQGPFGNSALGYCIPSLCVH
jgi:hypothetical protein